MGFSENLRILCWWIDKMKPAIVAKLSYQCSEYYADALKLLQLETLKSLWPRASSLHMLSREFYKLVYEYYDKWCIFSSYGIAILLILLQHSLETKFKLLHSRSAPPPSNDHHGHWFRPCYFRDLTAQPPVSVLAPKTDQTAWFVQTWFAGALVNSCRYVFCDSELYYGDLLHCEVWNWIMVVRIMRACIFLTLQYVRQGKMTVDFF